MSSLRRYESLVTFHSSPSLRRAVMEGIETMPRAAHTLGLRTFVSLYLSLRLHGYPWITCVLHSTEE